jgi:hypothetical protein
MYGDKVQQTVLQTQIKIRSEGGERQELEQSARLGAFADHGVPQSDSNTQRTIKGNQHNRTGPTLADCGIS